MSIKVIKIKPEFIDDRGSISRILDQDKIKIRSVLYITGKKGSARANHYHKKDYHFVYCLSGKFRYSEKNINNPKAKLSSVILLPGDLVLTKPMVFHAMDFLEDSVFVAFSSETREQNAYEKDTKRIKLDL
jgi:quercetin dioxygenase-like cupin family protein